MNDTNTTNKNAGPLSSLQHPLGYRPMHRCVIQAIALLLAALSVSAQAANVLMVTNNNGTLTTQESARKSQFEAWGHTVTVVWDADSQANYNTAIENIDVVYVSEEAVSTQVAYKLRTVTIGVISEEDNLDPEIGFATLDGTTSTATNQIIVTDNTHDISSGLATGYITIFTSTQPRNLLQGTRAAGLQELATSASGNLVLGYIETGGALANTYSGNSIALGRRVRLPWGGETFDFSSLDADGLSILQNALIWASGGERLVAHWKFDEGTGSTVADSSSEENDAAFYTGSPAWVSGVRGGALEFDGSNDVRTDAVFDPSSTSTVAFWFRGNGIPGTLQRLFGITTNWEVTFKTDGTLGFDLGVGGGFSSDVIFSKPGEWHHVVAITNSTADTYSLYVDGKLVKSGSSSLSDQGAGTLTIGGRTGLSDRFVGALDDLRIYNYELSPAEVAELYGLMGHWKLDETSGTIAADSSGLGNDGTVNGTVSWTSAVHSGGFEYDYTDGNDYIELPNSDVLDNLQEGSYTLSTWFNPSSVPPGTGSEDLSGYGLISKASSSLGIFYSHVSGFQVNHYADEGAGPVQQAISVPGYPPGQWYHVSAVVNQEAGTVQLYIDGELVGTNTFVSDSPGMDTGSGKWRLGIVNPGGSHERPAQGIQDDARIYNRALNVTEIKELYGLMGHWKLDETSGTVAADSSGLGNDGTYVNDPVLGDCGPYQMSAEFNMSDTDDRVDLPHTALNGSENASVSFWIRTSKTGTTSVLSGARASNHNSFLIYFASDTQLRLYKDGAQRSFTIPIVSNNQWHHFVVTWQGSSKLVTLYRNGELVGSGTISGATSAPIQIDPSGLMLAQEQDAVGGSFVASQVVEGFLDDVQIYNRVISATEVASLYGLMGHWKLDETSGTVAADSSPFANDGEYQNGPVLGKNGPINKAVEFDGTDDRVVVADQASYSTHTSSGLTVSAWVKVLTVNTDLHSQTRQPMVAKGIAPFWEWALYSYDGGYAGFSVWQAGGSSHSEIGGGSLPIGVWKHVVGTYEPGFGTRLYVDGLQTAQGTTLQGVPYDGLQPLLIGAREDDQYLNAEIDDVRIYHRILCPEEIEELTGGGVNGVRIIKWVETF